MPRGSYLSDLEKGQISNYINSGLSFRAIAKKINRSHVVVTNFANNPDYYGKNKSGGPKKKLSEQDSRRIINCASNTTKSLGQIINECEVNVSKPTISRLLKGKNINTRLDELEEENEALKDDINNLRHVLIQQNEAILALVRQQNDDLVETTEADKLAPQLVFSRKMSGYSQLFPLKSLKELDELEKLINDNNVNELVAVVQQLLAPHGIVKNILAVMSVECIMECNVDGRHNKRRLLNSQKFMDLLFQAAHYDGYSQKIFLEEVQHVIQMVKNRHNKNVCSDRQKEEQKQIKMREIKEMELIIPEEFIKTETI